MDENKPFDSIDNLKVMFPDGRPNQIEVKLEQLGRPPISENMKADAVGTPAGVEVSFTHDEVDFLNATLGMEGPAIEAIRQISPRQTKITVPINLAVACELKKSIASAIDQHVHIIAQQNLVCQSCGAAKYGQIHSSACGFRHSLDGATYIPKPENFER